MANEYMLHKVRLALQLGAMATVLPAWWLILLWHKLVPHSRAGQPWVISGHRGRVCMDNAQALFEHIAQNTEQPIVWIGNDRPPDGLKRGSWKARLAIARAPALIYSHGEDDLDPFLIVCRRLLAPRIYTGHGANLVKRGSMHREVPRHASPTRLLFQRFIATDYDLLLCHSALEQQFRNDNQPQHRGKHVVCGGPRLDVLLRLADSDPQRRIVWFPTFRDTAAGKRELSDVMLSVARNDSLIAWLRKTGRHLQIGLHINQNPDFRIEQASPEISLFHADELVDRLAEAQLLITDYSSAMIDWLIFDRPVICFPFDKSEYLAHRGLHLPYEDYVYGPVAHSTDELLDTLLNGTWHDDQAWHQRRAKLRDRFLPGLSAGNAAACFEVIRRHVDRPLCQYHTAAAK